MKKLLKRVLLIMTLIIATISLDVSAATNAPATLQAGANSKDIGYYDDSVPLFKYKTYIQDGKEGFAYCIDNINKSAPKSVTLTKSKELDAGYVYLIKNGYPNKSFTGNSEKDYYITQTAVWWYTDLVGRYSGLSSSYKNSNSWAAKEAKKLVDGALNARNTGYAKATLKLSAGSIKLTKTSDNKYYQSELITVSTTAVSGNYKVTLQNAPAGTIVVDANGNNKTSFATSEKFMVRIPVGNITELSYNFTATVSATGSVEKAYEYKASNSNLQSLLIARTYVETTPLTASVKFSVVETKVKISKQDITTKKELPGATLEVKDINGVSINKWVSTDEPHYINGLKEGKYTLTETIAPEGYELSTETITFEIENGKMTSVTMYNAPKKITAVKISKQDITTKKELSGATLELKDSTGKLINTWVSTDEPYYITGLKEGKYTLTETIAPKGYELSTETIEFEVKANGEITTVIMYNTPKKVETPKDPEEEVEVPITDTNIPPFVYMAGLSVMAIGSYLVIRTAKKENKQ